MQTLIGYIRVSTENQKDGYGLAIQESAIEEFAKNKGYNLVKIFRDEGVSGGLKNRPALIELIEFAEQNKDLTLAFLRLDRLARDLLVQENLIAEFKSKGLEVISIDEPDLCSNDPTRKLFRQMKGMLAEYEKAMITLRMSSGRLKKASLGAYSGGNVAFGFRVNGDGYIHVQRELDLVRKIFKLRKKPKLGKRMSYQKIADLFNEQGIPSPRNAKWHAMTVRYIHTNDFYKGFQTYSTQKVFNSALKIL